MSWNLLATRLFRVRVGFAKDDPYRSGEPPHLRDHLPPADCGPQEIVVQRPEAERATRKLRVGVARPPLSPANL